MPDKEVLNECQATISCLLEGKILPAFIDSLFEAMVALPIRRTFGKKKKIDGGIGILFSK